MPSRAVVNLKGNVFTDAVQSCVKLKNLSKIKIAPGVFSLTSMGLGLSPSSCLMLEAFVFHFLMHCNERSLEEIPCISASRAMVHGALPGGLQNKSF